MRKTILAILIVLLITFVSNTSLAMNNYFYEYAAFLDYVNNQDYAGLITAIEDYQQKHPLSMNDEWSSTIISEAERLRNVSDDYAVVISMMNSEYDIFDDVTYYWYGDVKRPDAQHNCVALLDDRNLTLYFHFSIDKYLGAYEYAGVVNNSIRIAGKITNDSFDIIDEPHEMFETFSIPFSTVTDVYSGEIESLAFRFYGYSEMQLTYQLDADLVEFLSLYAQCSSAFSDSDLRSLLWDWMEAVDGIKDGTIIPAKTARIMKYNSGSVYPSDTEIIDFYDLAQPVSNDVLKVTNLGSIYSGQSFLFPCVVSDISLTSKLDGYHCVEVVYKDEYGKVSNTKVIVLVSAEQWEQDWNNGTPAIGDDIILAATFTGKKDIVSPVFLLGFDEETQKLAKTINY